MNRTGESLLTDGINRICYAARARTIPASCVIGIEGNSFGRTAIRKTPTDMVDNDTGFPGKAKRDAGDSDANGVGAVVHIQVDLRHRPTERKSSIVNRERKCGQEPEDQDLRRSNSVAAGLIRRELQLADRRTSAPRGNEGKNPGERGAEDGQSRVGAGDVIWPWSDAKAIDLTERRIYWIANSAHLGETLKAWIPNLARERRISKIRDTHTSSWTSASGTVLRFLRLEGQKLFREHAIVQVRKVASLLAFGLGGAGEAARGNSGIAVSFLPFHGSREVVDDPAGPLRHSEVLKRTVARQRRPGVGPEYERRNKYLQKFSVYCIAVAMGRQESATGRLVETNAVVEQPGSAET
ncbi:hypothetical protein DFH06DRAFT_1129815 [Mycena polygramma]|nr:hypothetical protein DFH06DRAFT_1129815 [Mycena polygramma]